MGSGSQQMPTHSKLRTHTFSSRREEDVTETKEGRATERLTSVSNTTARQADAATRSSRAARLATLSLRAAGERLELGSEATRH